MRKIILGLLVSLLPLAAHADADQWGRTVTCVGAGPVSCSVSGLTASGATQAQAMGALNAMSPPQAVVAAVPISISSYDFMARLTVAEQTAVTQAGQSNAQVMLFLLKLAAVGTVNMADPVFQQGLSAMVSAGLLTQARSVQIANLVVASP